MQLYDMHDFTLYCIINCLQLNLRNYYYYAAMQCKLSCDPFHTV